MEVTLWHGCEQGAHLRKIAVGSFGHGVVVSVIKDIAELTAKRGQLHMG